MVQVNLNIVSLLKYKDPFIYLTKYSKSTTILLLLIFNGEYSTNAFRFFYVGSFGTNGQSYQVQRDHECFSKKWLKKKSIYAS